MELVWYERMDDFLEVTLTYLERDEALNNLMLGVALTVAAGGGLYDELKMVTVREGEATLAAGLQTVPANLMLYIVPGAPELEVLRFLAEGLCAAGVKLPGVIGPQGTAARFASLWSNLIGCGVELDMPLRVYELRSVQSGLVGEGMLRIAGDGDLDWIIQAISSFEQDAAIDESPDPERVGKLARRLVGRQGLYLWEHEGRVVSMAAKTRPTRHGIALNYVYTPGELRGRGYATSCVAALCQELLDEGYEFCTLFADLRNPTSNGVYLRAGFKPIGDFASYRFTGENR